jgi:hypothetical protein
MLLKMQEMEQLTTAIVEAAGQSVVNDTQKHYSLLQDQK